MPTVTKRHWVFTLHVTHKDEWDPSTIEINDHVTGLVCQLESAPTTGQLHYQGCVKFKEPVSATAVKKVIGHKAHVEAMKGTWDEAKQYCKKDKTRVEGTTPFEAGATGGQGQRSDLDALQEDIKEGKTMRQIADKHFSSFLRYNHGIGQYRFMCMTPRDFKTKVVIHYGAAGAGKSYNANLAAKDKSSFTLCRGNGDNIWWDGYDGQEIALLDDFYGWVRFSDMLQLMDRYAYTVEIKGARTSFVSKELHITSNAPPSK